MKNLKRNLGVGIVVVLLCLLAPAQQVQAVDCSSALVCQWSYIFFGSFVNGWLLYVPICAIAMDMCDAECKAPECSW